MKIVQLIIDENIDMAGVDGIALVEKPAHMENWLAFNQTKPVWESLSAEQMGDIAKVITQFGETENDLKEQGYVLVKVEEVQHYEFYDSNPNPSGEPDNSIRVRYKYVGPPAEREFCQIMMSANKVYTQNDLDGLSGADVNPIGPSGYSILQWRGSFNCRHKFVKLTYAPKNEVGNIVNKGTVRKGLINEQVGTQYDTRTTSTINAGNTPNPRVGGFSLVGKIDGQPLFSTKEEALQMAKIFGCEGCHEHKVGESTFYMPCEKHNFSYNDYPKQAKENACKVLRWIDEHGRQEVSGMERTGLQRANQLCKGERISEDTVRRMASFERHRRNSQIEPRFQGTPWRDKGYVAWLAWGGDEGIQWAQRKLSVLKKDFNTVEEDKEMVDGIIDLIVKVKDTNNRKEIARKVIRDFIRDEVVYNLDDFLNRIGISKQEIEFEQGVPHYTADGKLYTGPTHKDADGRLMTGEVHTEDSEYLYHEDDFAEVGPRGGIRKTPKAPKSDTPNPNPKGEGTAKGDASTTRGAKVSKEVEEILKKKSDDFNEKYKDKLGYGVDVGMLKTVYQRGVGAYNVSHSPNVSSSQQWALARVNAFLYIVKEGRPENKKYVGDNDLLPAKHPKKEEMELDLGGLTPYVSQTGKTITEEVMVQPNPCQSGWIAYGTKIKDGREVPNCIPVQQSAQFGEQKFSLDYEKREITGAAVIPNKFIIRYDEMMQPYYVFFSKETTKMLSEKFMKDNKMTDVANIEHTDKKADKTYVVESWLVEDTFNDKSNALGLEYPEGTWVITMKVQSDEVWNDIKKGKYKGYSIEGFFEEKLMFSEEDLVLQQINEIISETEL